MSGDAFAAYRRMERFLIGCGYDPNEPPDDRKTLDDISRYPRRHRPTGEGGEIIARITFFPDAQQISVKR